MAQQNVYKPRYTLAYLAKSKIWPYKDSYLRRFYALRARRVQRGGLFRSCVLVATTRKWTFARRFIRPFRRRAGSTTAAGIGGKTAFGRPAKRRYRDSFYIKQQLRFFHGKRKENTFRYLFKHYQNSVGNRTNSFFSSLESRLDRVLFRMRLFPTIYACHQFIHHHGLYLNNNIENSPRAVVRVGDIVTVPFKSWKPLYWDLFCRVYYRRWGLYIVRRRQYTQLKKKLFIMQSRRRHKLFRILVTRYPIATSIAKFKKAFFYKVINKESTIDFATKSKYNRAFYYTPGFSFFGKNSKTNHRLVSISNVRSKNALAALPSQIHSLLTELRMLNINKDSSFPVDLSNILSYRYAVSPSLSKQRKSSILPIKTIESFKSFFRNRGMVQSSLNTFNVKNDFDKSAIYKKRHILQKRVYSLRLHKSLLPSATRLRKFTYSTKSLNNIPYKKASFFYRAYLRGIYFRFINKRRKKRIRRRKIIRLKKLHFYIPTYLHVDFRTLRAIKISSPSLEEINYSFRGSLAKVYSYYSARGF